MKSELLGLERRGEIRVLISFAIRKCVARENRAGDLSERVPLGIADNTGDLLLSVYRLEIEAILR